MNDIPPMVTYPTSLPFDFSPETYLHATWYNAMREAELAGLQFVVFGHPLLPGWLLNVNVPDEGHPEVKPDPPAPVPPRLKYYARRRFIRS